MIPGNGERIVVGIREQREGLILILLPQKIVPQKVGFPFHLFWLLSILHLKTNGTSCLPVYANFSVKHCKHVVNPD